jgi:hypothetical protein
MPGRRGVGTLTIIKSIGNDRYEVVQNLATEDGARTMALDSKTGAVYLSTAKLGPRLRRHSKIQIRQGTQPRSPDRSRFL